MFNLNDQQCLNFFVLQSLKRAHKCIKCPDTAGHSCFWQTMPKQEWTVCCLRTTLTCGIIRIWCSDTVHVGPIKDKLQWTALNIVNLTSIKMQKAHLREHVCIFTCWILPIKFRCVQVWFIWLLQVLHLKKMVTKYCRFRLRWVICYDWKCWRTREWFTA